MGKRRATPKLSSSSSSSSSSSFPFPALAFVLVFVFALVFVFCSGNVGAAKLSSENQLDVLSAKIVAAENAVFNESNGSSTSLVFDKQGSGPYHAIFRYVAVYAPNDKPWNEIFELNTERGVADLEKNRVFNGLNVYLALPAFLCPGCYEGRLAPEKFKAFFYCSKTRGVEYPKYVVYWEGNSFTPDYEAVIDALTQACLDAQDEIARLEAIAPSPSPVPSVAPSPSAEPSVEPSVAPSLIPSSSPSLAGNETNSTNSTNSTNDSASSNGLVTAFARPASESGLVAAGSVSEDEQWMTYSALALVLGCVAIVGFYARKK